MPTELGEEQLASGIQELLLTRDATPERAGLLAAVVRRQLSRANEYFDGGHEEAGLAAVTGALYLVRVGELDPSMMEGNAGVLLNAAAAIARSGNEGQSLALYSMLLDTLHDAPERRDVESHLEALARWHEATRSDGPLQAAGADQRLAVDRSLLQPTFPVLQEAQESTLAWIRSAVTYGREQVPPRNHFERDEALEAYRAMRTGALVLTALHLRHGDAAGALAAIETGEVARVVPPNLHDALERALESDPEAWFELFSAFDSYDEGAPPEAALDLGLAGAAAWGAGVELCRAEPSTFRGVMPAATLLLRHGMAEAAPLLLTGALESEGADARALSWSLGFVLQAVVHQESIGDVAGARRTFVNATRLLRAAEARALSGQVSPTPSRLRYVMGVIETRVGELDQARPLVGAVVEQEPSLEALRLLAAIDRQRGAGKEALQSLEMLVQLATRGGDAASVAEAHITVYEIQRDRGEAAAARQALHTALQRALDARSLSRTGADQAAAERLLARILEHYGDDAGARRAMERAYEASRNDIRQLTVTVLEATRSALTRGDLKAAREAVRRALEAGLADEDIVYVALWLKLLEGRLDVASDGTAEEALSSIDANRGWPGKLRAWGTGRLNDAQLLKAARSRVERTEALFYAAMAKRTTDGQAALEQLEQVARSEAIQLVEVTIARDLLAEGRSSFRVEMPPDVSVP